MIRVDTTQARRKMEAVKDDLDRRPLLKAIGLRQLKWVNDNFKAEGLESPWPPLKPETIRRRRSGSSKPLQDTGRLRQSFAIGGTDNVFDTTADSVTIGTETIYAPPHEFGTEHIPQRKMLPSERRAEQLALDVIDAAIGRIRQRSR